MTTPGVHFAVLVVTKDRPTEMVLARALTPFGPGTMHAKLNWYALGGRFSGRLDPLDIADTVTGGIEYPDDELSQASDPRHEPGPGVDALRLRNLELITRVPCVVDWSGLWHEGEKLAFQYDEERPILLYLGELDPATRIFPREEVLAVEWEWERKFDELLDAVPPDYWISIVDCRAA